MENNYSLEAYEYELGYKLLEALENSVGESQELIAYVLELLEKGANINCQLLDNGYTALMLAIEHDFPTCFAYLLDANPNTSIENNVGTRAIHIAATVNNILYLESLLNRENIDIPDKLGNRPINYAIRSQRKNNISFLLEHECTTNFLNFFGLSIYDDARNTQNEEIINIVEHINFRNEKRLGKRLKDFIKTKINKPFK